MSTEVKIPQLGESVTEGTITAWLVQVGERVEADQPLFELSSDKIDTEVPAPASGVLTEIKVDVDETVDVGTVVAVIGDEGEEAAGEQAPEAEAEAEPQPEAEPEPEPEAEPEEEAEAEPEEEAEPEAEEEAEAEPEEEAEPAATPPEREPARAGARAGGNGESALMSPVVRRMLAENDLDASQISGSGKGGRITREDVEAALSGQEPAAGAEPEAAARAEAPAQPAPAAQERPAARPQARPQPTADRKRVESLSRIRQRIAAKMMESMQSSAQLTTVQEADVTRIMRLRSQVKEEFQAREGVSLSPFVFLARAAVLAVRNHPSVNAQADWDAGQVTYHDYINLGIAVDTEKGLIVPNVKGADDLSLSGLARAIVEVADKARGVAKLEMTDIEGGTFTLTNTGSRGVLLDTPILNYPEVAILATGAIQKRPVVVLDQDSPTIAIRDMVYLCLTYDHRLIDGADAARFVTDVAHILEHHDWAAEVGYDL